MPYDPEASAYTCDYCQRPLRPDALGVSRRVTGWIANRGKTGGGNAVRYPGSPTGYAHNVCLEAAHTGPQPRSLF